jgi:mannose/fructose/N-acetylgalactosamine-specific phosphotransferase system component IIB
MEIMFADVQGAIANHGSFVADPRKGILVTSDIATMERLIQGIPSIREVNVGGIHHRAGRSQKLRYVFLAPEEEKHLRALSDSGVKVTARDVPAAREVSINEMLGDAAPQTRTA